MEREFAMLYFDRYSYIISDVLRNIGVSKIGRIDREDMEQAAKVSLWGLIQQSDPTTDWFPRFAFVKIRYDMLEMIYTDRYGKRYRTIGKEKYEISYGLPVDYASDEGNCDDTSNIIVMDFIERIPEKYATVVTQRMNGVPLEKIGKHIKKTKRTLYRMLDDVACMYEKYNKGERNDIA